MKRKFSKLLCLLLVLVMAITILPTNSVRASNDSVWVGLTFGTRDLDNPSSVKNGLRFKILELSINGKPGKVSISNTYVEGDNYFGNCDPTVVIPESVTYENKNYTVTEIGNNALDSEKLQKITIPNTVKRIGMGAFSGSNLTNLILPTDLEYFGPNAISSCVNLESISISKNNPNYITYKNALYTKDKDGNREELIVHLNTGNFISIPNGAKIIGSSAFSCSRVDNDSVINRIIIPKSVILIKENAIKAKTIKFLSTTPPEIQDNYSTSTSLIVPKESLKLYKNLKYNSWYVASYVYDGMPEWSSRDKVIKNLMKESNLQKYITLGLKKSSDTSNADWNALKKEASDVTKKCTTDVEKATALYRHVLTYYTYDKGAFDIRGNLWLGIKKDYDYSKYNTTAGAFKYKICLEEGFNRIMAAYLTAVGIPALILRLEKDDKDFEYRSYAVLAYVDETWQYINIGYESFINNFNPENPPKNYPYYPNLFIRLDSTTEKFSKVEAK